ncbi:MULTISPECIES: hypothetical protein [Massilia]|uniref:hypothetical protein n=1 Tax=Massilia TaxID=149698 RepID=UPI0005946042|nr:MULTISPECIES: hypothetical protein [Massilia]QYG00115.1 hypothetical protein KY496_17155 [Massilia sp. NP310]
METTHESLPDSGLPAEPPVAVSIASTGSMPTRASLPAKGSCWYCEKPLDSVRRFCGKSCADSFDEEAEFTR